MLRSVEARVVATVVLPLPWGPERAMKSGEERLEREVRCGRRKVRMCVSSGDDDDGGIAMVGSFDAGVWTVGGT